MAVEHINKFWEDKRDWAEQYIYEECERYFEWEELLSEYRKSKEKLNHAVDNYKYHYYDLKGAIMKKSDGEPEAEVKGEIMWVDFTWYIDLKLDSMLVDYKAVWSHTKRWENKTSSYSPILSNEQKYKIQAYLYMKITGIKKTLFVEVLKSPVDIYATNPSGRGYKKADLIAMCDNFKPWDEKLTMPKIVEQYRPRKKAVQEIVIEWSEKLEKEVVELITPAIEEMKKLKEEKPRDPLLEKIEEQFEEIKKLERAAMDEKDATKISVILSTIADTVYQMELIHADIKHKYKQEFVKKKEL